MTDIKDQNCDNCIFVRGVPRMVTVAGKSGTTQRGFNWQCRYNPPPWHIVEPTDWCACWSDAPRPPA